MGEQKVFVSYSRRHQSLVTPLVQLLKLGNSEVFQDVTSIDLGTKWETSILEALNQSNVVVIIWCCHAAISEWVRKELRLAVETDKVVIPVRIDKTPLPSELGEFQGLDLSGEISHQNRAGYLRWAMRGTIALISLMLILMLLSWPTLKGWFGSGVGKVVNDSELSEFEPATVSPPPPAPPVVDEIPKSPPEDEFPGFPADIPTPASKTVRTPLPRVIAGPSRASISVPGFDPGNGRLTAGTDPGSSHIKSAPPESLPEDASSRPTEVVVSTPPHRVVVKAPRPTVIDRQVETPPVVDRHIVNHSDKWSIERMLWTTPFIPIVLLAAALALAYRLIVGVMTRGTVERDQGTLLAKMVVDLVSKSQHE